MPYKLDENGLQIPTRPELLGEMLADYQSPDPAVGYGPDADVSTDSPIYRIAQRVASQVALAWQAVRDWTGQLDPDNAVGQQLDRLGSLINLKRRGRTRSTIPGRLIGVPGTVVAAGGRVRYKPLGTLWDVPAGTIGASGTLAVDATSADFGPVDANAGGAADWEIVSGQVDGWTGFDSQSPATLGALAADDPEFRPEFKRAARGLATYDAIVREVRDVANVTNVYLYVNPSLDPDPLTGLKGKQMWLVVQGGARLDIAAAIHRSVGTPVDVGLRRRRNRRRLRLLAEDFGKRAACAVGGLWHGHGRPHANGRRCGTRLLGGRLAQEVARAEEQLGVVYAPDGFAIGIVWVEFAHVNGRACDGVAGGLPAAACGFDLGVGDGRWGLGLHDAPPGYCSLCSPAAWAA